MEHRVCIVIKGQVVCSLWFECSSSALINPFHRSEFHLLGGNKVSNFFHSRKSEGSTSMLPSFYMQDGGADYDVYDQKVLHLGHVKPLLRVSAYGGDPGLVKKEMGHIGISLNCT